MPALIVKVSDPRFDDAVDSGQLKHLNLVFSVFNRFKTIMSIFLLYLCFNKQISQSIFQILIQAPNVAYTLFKGLFVCFDRRLFTPASTLKGVDFRVHGRLYSRFKSSRAPSSGRQCDLKQPKL